MIGTTINDRYTIEAELGKGGMGTVYRAMDATLKRDVAVKIMSNGQLGTEGRARLLREAQLTAKLSHPNIVTVHDAGEYEEAPFIVMEIVEGKTLHEHEPESLEEIIEIAKQICLALDHAHKQEIIHRDLKPENIAFTSDGGIKLMDFGLARSAASRLTKEGGMVGTVFYMPPEQAMGDEVDARADLYSLGVMLYEMVTGVLPFEAEDAIGVITQHIHAPVVPPKAKREDIPSHLNRLIVKLLSKDPTDRPASAKEVIELLETPSQEGEDLRESKDLSLLDRIVRGRIVGRQKEITKTRELWKKAAGGTGQLLLISGEPGIGKTRFTREVITHVEVSGGKVLLGASYTEGGAPYSSFAQIVRKELLNGGASDIPEHILADMILIAPDLKPHFEHITPNPKLEPQHEQQRMLENLLTFFNILAEQQPLLVVLEDVHWADGGTLLILRHLARNLANKAVMIAATYREVELDENLPLNNTLDELNRERLGQRIKLRRLTSENTREMLTAMFADTITDEFLSLIYDETEGNPFFTEELCKALVDSGQLYFEDGKWHRPPDITEIKLPQSIRVAIQSRVNKLDEGHLELLRTAAVFGHEFDFDSLTQASQVDENAIIDALEAAEQAQIIRELNEQFGGTFSFVHALIPVTLVESVSNLRQRRMQQQAADAILAVRPDDFETIAYHFSKAGKLDSARENYLKAAERAEKLTAFSDAVKQYSLALESWPESDLRGKADSLSKMGLLKYFSWGVGDHKEVIEIYQEAKEIYTEINAMLKVGEMERRIGRINWLTGEHELTFNHYLKAYEILSKEPESEELAFAMSSISQLYALIPDPENAIEWGEKALTLAKKIDAKNVIPHILNNLGMSWTNVGEYHSKGESMMLESHERNHALGNYYEAGRAIHNNTSSAEAFKGTQAGIENAKKVIQYARDQHVHIFETTGEVDLMKFEVDLGKWKSALERSTRVRPKVSALILLWHHARLGNLLNHLGMHKQALEDLEEVYEQALSVELYSGSPVLHQISRAKIALSILEEGKAHLIELNKKIEVPPITGNISIAPLLFAIKFYVDQDDQEKLNLSLNFLEKAKNDTQSNLGSTTSLTEANGYIALNKKNFDEAIQLLNEALAGWEEAKFPYHQLRVLHLLGSAHTQAGDEESAKNIYLQAKEIVDQLAGELDDEEYKTSFLNTPMVKDVLEGVR